MKEALIVYENDQIVIGQGQVNLNQDHSRNSIFKINLDSQNWKNRSLKGMKIFYIYKDLSNMNEDEDEDDAVYITQGKL